MRATHVTAARWVAVALAALATSACAALSPTPSMTPYDASDGVSAQIANPGDGSVIKLQNFLYVTAAKGQPGTLLGAVINEGTTTTTLGVSIQASDGTLLASGTLDATPATLVSVGPGGTSITIAATPTAPGTLLKVVAHTAAGGDISLEVPVLAPTGAYASITAG